MTGEKSRDLILQVACRCRLTILSTCQLRQWLVRRAVSVCVDGTHGEGVALGQPRRWCKKAMVVGPAYVLGVSLLRFPYSTQAQDLLFFPLRLIFFVLTVDLAPQ